MGWSILGALGSTGSPPNYPDFRSQQDMNNFVLQQNQRRLSYVANRGHEWLNRNSETRRVLRRYWRVCVGDNPHYKSLCNFDDFISHLEIYLQSNPKFVPPEEIQQDDFDYLIEQANQQALRRLYQTVAERTGRNQQRVIEVCGILTEELRRDEIGRTCTQKFIDSL